MVGGIAMLRKSKSKKRVAANQQTPPKTTIIIGK